MNSNKKTKPDEYATCMDCGLTYRNFGLDMVLPRGQWLTINPKDDGLLCARCIVIRASNIEGVICVHATIETVMEIKS